MSNEHDPWPKKLAITTCQDLFEWYRAHLCRVPIIDPRGYRVSFVPENFIHLIKLKNEYGREPGNARLAVKRVEQGRFRLVDGRFDRQRAMELPWARVLATRPDCICSNWVPTAVGEEAYIKNFGTPTNPLYRILICQVIGKRRRIVTIFPRRTIGKQELDRQIWP